MKNATTTTLLLLGVTTLQVLEGWLVKNRQWTRLSLMIWLSFLVLLGIYSLLLRSQEISRPLKRLHYWVYCQITATRLLSFGLIFLSIYGVWYARHVWGKLLIVSDFGSLYYRYSLLQQIFPHVLAYNPMFNGGYETFELLRTGSINLFLITYPITALFSLETALKAQPLLLIFLLPVLIYLSGRLVGFSPAESLFSSLFALVMTPAGHSGVMQLLFHGTLPFVFSNALAPVVFALSYRVFILGKNPGWGIPLIILLGSLGSFHPFFPLVVGPLSLAIVFSGRIHWKQKIVYCVLIGAGLLVINGSEIKEILFYKGGEHITGDIVPSWLSLRVWLTKLEQNFLGIPVSLAIASMMGVRQLLQARETEKRQLGWLLLFAILYCAFLSSLHFLILSLEPQHFVLPLSIFVTLALGPSWSLVRSLWAGLEERGRTLSFGIHAALLLLAVFLCLPYSLYFTAFSTAPPIGYQLVDWFKQNAGHDGRVFFYRPGGFHDLREGDATFHHTKAERPTMGHSTLIWPRGIHILNREIEECLWQLKPATDCKDLYNIRYAITFSSNGGAKNTSTPEQLVGFKLVETLGRMQIYESEQPSSYFLVGHGQVQQQLNRIAVEAEPSEFVVLKFFWVPGLRTDPPLTLEPYPLPNGRAFIKIRSNYHKNFVIFYRWRELANSD